MKEGDSQNKILLSPRKFMKARHKMGDLKSIKAPSLRPTAAAGCSLPATARSRVGHGLLSAAAGVMAVIFLGVKNMIINNAFSRSLSHFFLRV